MTNLTPYFELHNAEVFQRNLRVFNQVSVLLNLTENTCILGPNGAGKSTLLQLLTRELYPVVKDNSWIKWFGQEQCTIWQLSRKIGLVSQSFQQRYDAHVLGRDVVLSGLFGSVGMHGHQRVSSEQQEQLDLTLTRFNLTPLANKRYWHLSTGQQRRLLLARAMIHNPEVLILDEPTNGLDLQGAFDLINELRNLCQSGTTLLLVTHHLQEIIPEVSRLIALQNGSIIYDGSKKDYLTSQPLSKLFNTPLEVVENKGFYLAYPGSA